MTYKINTVTDLRNWVWEHTDSTWVDADLDKITDAIRAMPDCPEWGTRWNDFFDTLPDNLSALIVSEGDS